MPNSKQTSKLKKEKLSKQTGISLTAAQETKEPLHIW